jgi:hypothetical protein
MGRGIIHFNWHSVNAQGPHSHVLCNVRPTALARYFLRILRVPSQVSYSTAFINTSTQGKFYLTECCAQR